MAADRFARDPLGRRLELWWRRQVVRALTGILWLQDRWADRRPRAAAAAPVTHRVLFLRPDRIGDMIVTTGVLRAIGSAPAVALDVLASPENAAVLAREPHVCTVHVLNRRRWRTVWPLIRTLRAERYDVVVDCMATAPSVTTLLLMLASGAVRRVGAGGRGLDAVLTSATPALPLESHIVDHLAQLVTPFRHDVVDPTPVLVLDGDELAEGERLWDRVHGRAEDVRLLVNISAGKLARRWPLASYACVIKAARDVDPYLRVAIMSAPHERPLGETLATMCGGNYVPTRTLREAFAFVAAADTLFTPDTSVAHAAAALGVPTVDLLLAGTASRWGLYRAPGINLESPDGALSSLSALLAAEALVGLLKALRDGDALRDGGVYFTPSCLRRKATVRGQASLVAARFAASSDSSRLAARGSLCARRNPCTAPS
ncbi:MAG: glycosyltransferase family 9 protein [Gemmatimonas sp.]|nr:glycosyltransferase family 9 protein [Gemmatimonas sp.]